jgi:iron complex transport system substrate-binding protein
VRVVALTCSNTEIVCHLGCEDLLVGVDDHSDWPESVVARLPRVGPDLDIDVDRVLALEPDLVLASLTVPGHERVVERIERAGLRFIATEPVSLADVYRDIEQIAELLGAQSKGSALVRSLRAELDEPPPTEGPRSVRPLGGDRKRDRPKVLVEWWPKPVIVPGRDSWVTQLLEAAGGENPMRERPVKSAPITDDEAIALSPDAVVISWCGVKPEKYRPDIVYRRPAWRTIPAIEHHRVYCVPEAFLGRPGPRLIEGYRAFRRIVAQVHGE